MDKRREIIEKANKAISAAVAKEKGAVP